MVSEPYNTQTSFFSFFSLFLFSFTEIKLATLITPHSKTSSSSVDPVTITNEPIFAHRSLVVINVGTQAYLKLTEAIYFPWKTI